MPSEMVMKENKFISLNDIIGNEVQSLSDYQKSIIEAIKRSGGTIELKKIGKLGFNISGEFKKLVDAGVLSITTKMESDVKDMTIRGIELNYPHEKVDELIVSMESSKLQRNQSEVLKVLKDIAGPISEKDIIKDYGFSKSTIQTLARKDIIRYIDIKVSRDPYSKTAFAKNEKPMLTQDQADVLDKIILGYRSGKSQYLLHGVTGSGKTEIYMRLIEYMIDSGKQAIMLVPEISLTPQTIERFKGRFERVAVMHSRLSPGEKYDEWKRIKNNEVDVVVGARSAVFAPFDNLGVIIIDEEHENSYKSDKTPKYVTKM
jgi:primosomal protein N' (replication factor Y)